MKGYICLVFLLLSSCLPVYRNIQKEDVIESEIITVRRKIVIVDANGNKSISSVIEMNGHTYLFFFRSEQLVHMGEICSHDLCKLNNK